MSTTTTTTTTDDAPSFPLLVHLQRHGQAPTWETLTENVLSRVQQLDQDPMVTWFNLYQIDAFTLRKVKKTIVVSEDPNTPGVRKQP